MCEKQRMHFYSSPQQRYDFGPECKILLAAKCFSIMAENHFLQCGLCYCCIMSIHCICFIMDFSISSFMQESQTLWKELLPFRTLRLRSSELRSEELRMVSAKCNSFQRPTFSTPQYGCYVVCRERMCILFHSSLFIHLLLLLLDAQLIIERTKWF